MEIVRLHLARIDAMNGIPVHGFVIKHPSAGAILVDTGVGWPADMLIVINTHLHFDHCGQNAVFKHAPFYIQRPELERARRQETVTAQWFDFAGARFELLDGDAEVAEGVRVVATPGHTVGHQSVLVDTSDGGAVMIGDAAYTADIYREAETADLSRWRGQFADREAWTSSLHRLHDLHPHAVHFCHDTRVVTSAG